MFASSLKKRLAARRAFVSDRFTKSVARVISRKFKFLAQIFQDPPRFGRLQKVQKGRSHLSRYGRWAKKSLLHQLILAPESSH